MKVLKNRYRQFLYSCFLSIATITLAQAELPLMPYPRSIEVTDGKYYLDQSFQINLGEVMTNRLNEESSLFIKQLVEQTGLFLNYRQVNSAVDVADLTIKVDRFGIVKMGEDESYQLTVNESGIALNATTDIGASRGLMTLLQLIDGDENGYYVPHVAIKDAPRFQWRGLMLDVARHYLPLETLYRNIDAMAAVKLNVLHLHLSDDQGFRFESKLFPDLNIKGTDGNYYTQGELKDLIAYADQRGIMIIPEIDVPGHATAILTAFPEFGSKDTTYVLERFAGIFDPTLDPTNEEVYAFLDKLFGEIIEVFPAPYFHIGGDENLGKHWDQNADIQAFMRSKGLETNHELQSYFNLRLQRILNKYDRRMMGWEEIQTNELEESAVIHSWRGAWEGAEPRASLYHAASEGYETILSNGYYLDLIFTAEDSYRVDPAPSSADISDEERSKILGGEVCMWSELVVPQTIDSRLWPRAAAIAERFWSPEAIKDVDDMYARMEVISLWLENFGLKHISSPNRILRKLAAGHDTAPLERLLALVEPMKGYTRNPGGTMYNTFSPYTKWADAATADALGARRLNNQIECYLNGKMGCGQIKDDLEELADNHGQVQLIIQDSPSLREIEQLSANTSKVAVLAIEAMNFMETNAKPNPKWFAEAKELLTAASQQGGRTELQIVTSITNLVAALEGEVK
ncbi:beta-N-acetylhexosaminidase [Marinoscillum sp.]|uniref:beta-N-acetylhexosaminidase n=1 Tax=Marinoscillum sp. TaxID=2024838 RepID=UPI003BAC2BD8